MLSQSVIYLIMFGIALSTLACNTQEPSLQIDPTQSKVSSKNFEKEIPIEKTGRRKGELDFYYKFLKENVSALKIGSLELGYDSLQLRLWLGHELAIKRNLVIIKFSGGKRHADLLTFWMAHEKNGEPYIAKQEKTAIAPKTGWKNFLDTLFGLKILTLPHCEDIPGYNGCGAADGINYFFEVATVEKYRFYYYCNPDYTLNNFSQAYNVMQFAAFVEKEFRFEYTK